MMAVELDFVIRPCDLAVIVKRCDAAAAEDCINSFAVRRRSRCRVRIVFSFLRRSLLEDFGIPENRAIPLIDAQNVTRFSFVVCGS